MASSSPVLIPTISKWIWGIKPESILDVGIGFGRYGFLCREVLEIWNNRYFKKDWKVKIDGVEIFEPFITPLHEYLYDKIIIDDITHIKFLQGYDLIILGDVLEHLPKKEGLKLIKNLRTMCKWVIIQTPYGEMKQGMKFGNPAEEHLSVFFPEDFNEYYPQMILDNNVFAVLIRGEL